MMKSINKIKIISLFLVMTLFFSGCGIIPSVELTEEEQKIIAEYAAGLLLKHDRNYSGSIVKIETEEENSGLAIIEENIGEAPEPMFEEIPEQISEEPVIENNTTEDIVYDENGEIISQPPEQADMEYSDMSIAQAAGLDGFEIMYKSCEVSDIYPREESDNLVFSMQASPDMELLICHFSITNDSPDAKLCDVLNSGASFRLVINGTERVNAQRTILLDDLVNFSDSIEGYGMVDAVIIFEVSRGTADSISSLDLVVKKGEESTTHPLR